MNQVLQRAIERHGGFNNYRSVGAVKVKMNQLGGAIPVFKGLGKTFPHPDRATVDPRRKSVIFHGFGTQGEDVTYSNGTIVSAAGRHEKYRTTFDGLRKLRLWPPTDAAYFFGYALSDYFSFPFSLASLEILACQSLPSGQSKIEVRFPKNADTHSEYQSFWFDASGLLYRHDYRADVLGPIFSARITVRIIALICRFRSLRRGRPRCEWARIQRPSWYCVLRFQSKAYPQ